MKGIKRAFLLYEEINSKCSENERQKQTIFCHFEEVLNNENKILFDAAHFIIFLF